MAASSPSGAPIPLRTRLIIAAAIVVVFVIVTSGAAASFYADLAWFGDMGQAAVFWTRIWSEWGVGALFGIATFVLLIANVIVARRLRPHVSVASYPPGTPLNPQQQLEQVFARVRGAIDPFAGWIATLLAVAIGFNAGGELAGSWQTFRLALLGPAFGKVDPQFGLDVGFFVFRMPALRLTADWLMSTLVLALVITLVIHLYEGGIRPAERLRGFDPHVKAHVSVLLALIVAAKAFDYYLSIFELDYSPRGQVIGASYADVHAQLPAYWVLIAIAVVVCALLLLNIRYKGWRLPLIGVGVWVAASVLIGTAFPALVQQFIVAPNELVREKPYIQRNITTTREAFDLSSVDATSFPATADLTSTDIVDATSTVKNVRLWDPAVIVNTYKQLQEIRFYYDFHDVDIDRYVIDGVRQQVLVSAREMNTAQLSSTAKTWINEHLVYTHGYGAVVSPVNEVSPDGLPTFIVKDFPPKSSTDLKLTVPGIYFGEETGSYAIVDTTQKEFDYPVGGENATTSYGGGNGVPVGSLGARLAFWITTGDSEILFSSAITPTSRILYHRTITDRARTLAPWLKLDGDPYPVITKAGRLVWVLDGYTNSTAYPYSQPDESSGVNYIRNSVKVTIDAYSGKTTFYAFDTTDPMLRAYMSLYPTLFADAATMPADIRAHLRFPEDLFRIQAEMYKTYHMLDPQVFYNKEDQWALPGEAAGSPMAPFYLLMQLPGDTSENFLLMEPFTPRSKDNMIGWMAVKSDPGTYGQRTVYNFPKQRLVMGPQQIHARLNQEPDISKELTLLNQQGSQVIFGNLLVIPIRNSIVYIQPLYIQASQSPMPELKRVIVAYGDRIAMAPDLATALTDVFGAAPTGIEGGSTSPTVTPVPPTPPATGTAAASDAAKARDLYAKAIAAQKAGDWAAYGTYIKQLGALLDRLAGSGGK